MTRTPTPEQAIAQISAGTSQRRTLHRDQVNRLAEQVDWMRMADALRTRRLLSTLGPRMIELTDDPDPGFVDAVEVAIESGRRHGLFLQLTSERALSLLTDAGLRSAPLKGPLLATSIYGDPGRRQSNDIDLLVAPDHIEAAVSTVLDLGYRRPDDFVTSDGLPLLHFTLLHERGTLPPLELHWRIHWYERCFAADRLLPPSPTPPGRWRPAPIDELASLLLFYARDGFVGLRLAVDLSAWWDKYGGQISPAELAETLRLYPGLARVIPASAAAAERVVGLPGGLRKATAKTLGPRQRTAARLANPNPRPDQAELYATAGLIDGLLAPRGGFFAFLRRQIFPPREVREQQARHGEKESPRAPLSRATGIIGRYVLTLLKAVLPLRRSDRASATVGR